LPVIATIFVLIWVYEIKVSNEKQVAQNKKIIQLLKNFNNKQ